MSSSGGRPPEPRFPPPPEPYANPQAPPPRWGPNAQNRPPHPRGGPYPAPPPHQGRFGPAGSPAPGPKRETVVLLCAVGLFMGCCGLQRFYLKENGMGVALLLTLGFCGVGQIIDLVRFATLSDLEFQRRYAGRGTTPL